MVANWGYKAGLTKLGYHKLEFGGQMILAKKKKRMLFEILWGKKKALWIHTIPDNRLFFMITAQWAEWHFMQEVSQLKELRIPVLREPREANGNK